MFLNDFFGSKAGAKYDKYAREASTFNAFYVYWRDNLFERIMRLFEYKNMDEVLAKEIEQRLIIEGHCGLLPFKDEMTAFFGKFVGVSKYYDEKPKYSVTCPIWAKTLTIGKEVVVINANRLRNDMLSYVDHYAILLAHADVSCALSFVNMRDAGGVPVAADEIQKQSIKAYQCKIFNGEYGVVSDPAYMGINYAGSDRRTAQSIAELWETRMKIFKDFYSGIGVRTAFEKRSNAVVDEVEADTPMLLFNISDMLKSRKEGLKKVNKLFGTDYDVELCDELKYLMEEKKDGNSERYSE